MEQAQRCAPKGPQGDEAVENGGFTYRPREPPLVAEQSGHADRAGGSEHRYGQKAAADEAEGEQSAGKVSCEGLEGVTGNLSSTNTAAS